MSFFKPKEPTPPSPAVAPPSPPQLLQQTLTTLQTHFSNFIDNLHTNPPFRNPFAKIPNKNDATFASNSSSVVTTSSSGSNFSSKSLAVPHEVIEERLAGVPVYALSKGSQEFVLVSGANTGKHLGLFCFGEADAETLLEQMRSVDPSMSSGSQVVAVALSKIFELKGDGVALRLIPEASQIKNALKERKRAGIAEESFPGVPVFQSKSLILRSQSKTYRPVFFRKEDLEKSMLRASRDQKQLNHSLREGDIQVAVLEDIIQGMKDSSVSLWDDVVFIPPGFDVSTDLSRQH